MQGYWNADLSLVRSASVNTIGQTSGTLSVKLVRMCCSERLPESKWGASGAGGMTYTLKMCGLYPLQPSIAAVKVRIRTFEGQRAPTDPTIQGPLFHIRPQYSTCHVNACIASSLFRFPCSCMWAFLL